MDHPVKTEAFNKNESQLKDPKNEEPWNLDIEFVQIYIIVHTILSKRYMLIVKSKYLFIEVKTLR